jgi:membrane protein DedA with SNARE-associated domain
VPPIFVEYGYVGVFAALICSGFGLPIPEELPVLTAGVLCGHADTLAEGKTALDPDRLHWYVMLPVCILGVVIGDGILYGIGRVWGPRLLESQWVQRKLLPPDKRAKIEKNFHDRGVLILLTARVTPGIRSPIFLMAGVLRVPLARFLLADGLYAVPGVSTMFFLAYFLTDQVLEVFNAVDRYRPLVIVGVLSAIAGVFLYRFLGSRRVTTGAHSEVPLLNRPVEMVTEAATHAVEKTVHVAAQAVEKTLEAVTHHRPAVEKVAEKVAEKATEAEVSEPVKTSSP